MLWTQAFVCNLGFSIAHFFCGFIVNLFCNAYYFQWYHLLRKSVGQYYILIKPKIIVLTEYVVIKKPLDEYYRAVFGFFFVNKVPSLLKWLSIYCSCN